MIIYKAMFKNVEKHFKTKESAFKFISSLTNDLWQYSETNYKMYLTMWYIREITVED